MRFFTHRSFILIIVLLSQQITAQKLAEIPYVAGINAPIDLKNCGDERLFVAERGGRIRIINADGTLRTDAVPGYHFKNIFCNCR